MKPVSPDVSFPSLEEEILESWKKNKTFERSSDPFASHGLNSPKDSGDQQRPAYVFYDGPPFATGLPHYGHLLAGTIKDVVGRFFTMKGYHVERRFGWDCHGVPVEFEIQKTLDLKGSKEIREFGVANFNEECRAIVQRYTEEWKRFIDRSGRWVDFNKQYKTMDKEFMESVWWAFSALYEKGLVYESFKCVAYSPGISTPLSNFEANLNYKDVQDPAVAVRANVIDFAANTEFKDLDKSLKLSLCVWTTTPWTLPSNTAIGVNNELDYAIVKAENPSEYVIVAEAQMSFLFPELDPKKKLEATRKPEVVKVIKGSSLVGLSYSPFYSDFEEKRKEGAFRVFHGDFVSSSEGTGLVHLASFGEDDLSVFLANNLPIIDPIDPDGNFTSLIPSLEGKYFKDADPIIIANLKEKGLLLSSQTINHSYPFCWRTDKPLMYKAISSWFIRVEEIKERLIASNERINWIPEHVKTGRFGKWLENARDWAISRNRFWGTPIPIWRAETGEIRCIGSIKELEELTGKKIDDLHTHKIDDLDFICPNTKKLMKRIPEVLDCWFESGAMPYAQAHYPFENKEKFEGNFPADFIAEGLDQTRGWFYTLLVLSTALFNRPAFQNVVVNGIILAEDGRKMSKSLKNYPPADEVMNKYGADALRMYMLSSPASKAEELRFSEAGVKDVIRQTLIPFWNAYNFFVTYAVIDQWTVEKGATTPSPNLLDKWILSRLATTAKQVDGILSSYRLYLAAPPILTFIDELTNWYIRLNRRRFWQGGALRLDANSPECIDKNHAYTTLYTVLSTFSRIIAPLMPFVSESIFKNLTENDPRVTRDSVHLTPFPTLEELSQLEVDEELEIAMELFEEIIVLGRALRNEHEVKLRQPLSKLTIVHGDPLKVKALKRLDHYLKDELNIKVIVYEANEESYVTLSARLNTIKLGKTLGPKLGKQKMSELTAIVMKLSTSEIRRIESGGELVFEEEKLSRDDILISRKPKESLTTAASSGAVTIILDTSLSPELRLEGLAREFVNRVQKLRKELQFDIADRIVVKFLTSSPQISMAVKDYDTYIKQETLAVMIEEMTHSPSEDDMDHDELSPQDIDGDSVIFNLSRIQS